MEVLKMNEIRIAQMFMQGKDKMMFLQFKGGLHRVEYYNLESKKQGVLSLKLGNAVMQHPSVTVLDEFDYKLYAEIVNKEQQKLEQKNQLEGKVRAMKSGQVFIGTDNTRYVFDKFNRTKFEFHIEGSIFDAYTAKPQFVKEITDEVEKEVEISPQKITRDVLLKCNKLVKEFAPRCGLDNEGEIGASRLETGNFITVYNDGFKCCAMINGKYILGIGLEDNIITGAKEYEKTMIELGIINKKAVS